MNRCLQQLRLWIYIGKGDSMKGKASGISGERFAERYDYGAESNMSDMISSAIANKKRQQVSRRRNKSIAAAVGIFFGLALIAACAYFGGWIASMGKFLPNTYINDINVSGMTPKEAAAAIQMGPPTDYLSLTERDGSAEHIPLDYFDYEYDLFRDIKSIFDEQKYSMWFVSYFEQSEHNTEGDIKFNEQKLEYCLRNTIWGSVDTQDAKMVYENGEYKVQPEVYGDTLNLDKLVPFVVENVKKGIMNMDIKESGAYIDPKVVTADIEGLVQKMNEKYNFTVTYDFDYATEELTGAEVYKWTKADGTVDRSKAEAFIDKLAEKYDTFMTTRSFQTTERGVIQISQGRYSTGQYGWWIDKEKSVDKLMQYIEAAESRTVEPIYVTLDTGYTYEGFRSGRSAESDIGDTYIEIDLSAQHLWYYKDGQLAFETTQIVSGKATDPNRKTPEGIYSVYVKNTDYTMVASDGSYRTKCSYFMRCSFEGIGLHDLSRGSYGGNTYINNGSHGCINMRYGEVQTLYNMVERGTPVVMYY